MKNNTIAIALAAMLVGGVATAGYMNNRPDAGTSVYPERMDLAGTDAPMAYDNGVATPGQLQYAEVVGVEPIIESEPLYATVIGTEAIRETSTSNNPQQVCEDVVVQERMPERDGNVGGTVAGALIGGLVGNQIGGGSGRKAATVGGAVAGGYIGNRVDRNHVGGQVASRTDRRCRTVNNSSTSSRTVGWNVTYRNPDGSTATMRTDKKPGERIALGNAERTVGYEVSYRVDGQVHSVRMDQPPGDRLPMIDGQIVTQLASVSGTPNG